MSAATTEVKDGDPRVRVIRDSGPESPRDWDNLGTMVCWHRNYSLGDFEKTDKGRRAKPKYETSAYMFLDILRDAEASLEVLRPVILQLIKDPDNRWRYKQYWLDDAREDKQQAWLDFIDDRITYGYNSKEHRALAQAASEVAYILPLYLYDHSGITMNTSGFNDRWDSGMVGYIFLTHKRFDEETSWKDETLEAKKQHAERVLKGEVETYDQYLRGDIYGFVAEKASVCECCSTVEWEETDSCWGFYGTDEDNGMKDHLSPEYHEALKAALENPEYGR